MLRDNRPVWSSVRYDQVNLTRDRISKETRILILCREATSPILVICEPRDACSLHLELMELPPKGLVRTESLISYPLIPHVLVKRGVREEEVIRLSSIPLTIPLESKAPDILPPIIDDF